MCDCYKASAELSHSLMKNIQKKNIVSSLRELTTTLSTTAKIVVKYTAPTPHRISVDVIGLSCFILGFLFLSFCL